MQIDFARNATDALQCYADLQKSVELWTDDFVRAFANTSDPPELRRWLRDFFLGEKMKVGDDQIRPIDNRVYFWPSNTSALVTAGADTYPLDPNRFALPEYKHLFFVFQQPTLLQENIGPDGVQALGPLSALSFCAFGGRAWIWSLVWSRGCLWPGAFYMYAPAECIDDTTDKPPVARTQTILKWLSVAYAFAEADIIGSAPFHVGTHVQRRIVGHVPDVHIVQLRRIDAPSGERRPTLTHIDFDFRIWVSGHEKMQFFPSTGERHKITINPYLRGPDDKPIKDRDTVYAVTR